MVKVLTVLLLWAGVFLNQGGAPSAASVVPRVFPRWQVTNPSAQPIIVWLVAADDQRIDDSFAHCGDLEEEDSEDHVAYEGAPAEFRLRTLAHRGSQAFLLGIPSPIDRVPGQMPQLRC